MKAEGIDRLIATGKANYSGYLREHIRLIVAMHSRGHGCSAIADHLNRTFKEFRDASGYWVNSTQSANVRYVLERCGIESVHQPSDYLAHLPYADLFPSDVLIKQAAWDRRARILRMVQSGCMTNKKIGQMHGISGHRIAQIRDQALRERRRPGGSTSPVERYLNMQPLDLHPTPRLVAIALRGLTRQPRRDWIIP